jgi:osmoprotectant transport system ATP-binding protein
MSQPGSVHLTHVSLTLPGSSSGRKILDDISLELKPGTATALLGRSGSGKTTLLRAVNALTRPTSGEVFVDGTDILALASEDLRQLRHRIGYVIQETGLFPHMTIERNVALALELSGRSKSEQQSRAAELLALVGLDPVSFARRHPHQLSGGQRQRVGLARALAAQPSILLLDEPFGALDPLTRAEMQSLLHTLLQRVQTTTLLVTHDLQEALYLADTIVFMEAGKIHATLTPQQVNASSDSHVVAYRNAAQGHHAEVQP